MIAMINEMLSYSFMVRALVVGTLVSLCAALLGVSLVLKRYSMIGDGLSHVGFGALSVALALNLSPLMVSIPVMIAAAFFLLWLSKNRHINGDAAIALVSTSAMAVGVIVTSLTSGMNIDVYSYMFGSILAMSMTDVHMSVCLSIFVLVLFVLLYNRIFAVTFDENFAYATGTHTNVYNMCIALLTAITVVLGMRMMGTLLISSLIIFPALSAMRVFRRFLHVVLCASGISLVCFFAGMLVSYGLSIPAGASVVAVNILAFLIMWLVGILMRQRVQ